ncbi:hypothetical protein GP486_007333 [Trichoglossum hirsutum]|uniref:Ricin B lectin domain-containing protein n=1 Tax=Trichoglossum hirsutum TaxID=265104 RepID=A0A9P8IC25_9PEZI|nr:hypothetical protein GP486_007333 [Trichoglossum hirsutum]
MAASFDSNAWYRLTNRYLGTSIALDVINDGLNDTEGLLTMAPSADYSGQYWQLLPQSSGTFKLRTMFLGPDRVLDVYENDSAKPHLAIAGNYSGQNWMVERWGDGTWKLSNAYSGLSMHLDTYSDTHEPFLEGGDHTGQHWSITAIEDIPAQLTSVFGASPTYTTESSTPSTYTSASRKTPGADATSTVAISQTTHFPKSTKIVLAVLGTVIILALAIFAYLWFLYHRASMRQTGSHTNGTPIGMLDPEPQILVEAGSSPVISRSELPIYSRAAGLRRIDCDLQFSKGLEHPAPLSELDGGG